MLFEEFLEKGRRFCAYRDRSLRETAERLQQLGASPGLIQRILHALREEGFVDNERFARALVRGKFRNNQWGRIRILQELGHHQIPESVIEQALTEIDEEEYIRVLNTLAQKKFTSLRGETPFNAKGKTAQYCLRKGFESSLVWDIVNKL